MESRLNSSEQDSIRCSSAKKSKVYCTDWEKHQKFSQEEFYSCRCSTTFPVEQETMNKNVWQTLDSYLCMQENLVKGQWSFIGPCSEKKESTRNLGQYCGKDAGGSRRKRMSNFPCNKSIVQRSTQKQRTS